MKDLNTMDTFNNGFKIDRNGEIITLTSEEMVRFRFLDIALTGRNCLDCYLDYLENDDENKDIVKRMMKDEQICYNIEDNFLECVYQDSGDLEHDIIKEYIDRYKNKFEEE